MALAQSSRRDWHSSAWLVRPTCKARTVARVERPPQHAERSRSRENPLFVTYSQLRHADLSAGKPVGGFPNPAYAIKVTMQFSILPSCRARLCWLTTIRLYLNKWRPGLLSWRAGWPRVVTQL